MLPAASADHAKKCTPFNYYWTAKPITIRFASPNGTYFLGDTVGIRVYGSNGMVTSDIARMDHTRLELEAGGAERFAEFVNHTGRNQFNQRFYARYSYTVQSGDMSNGLDYKESSSLYWVASASNERIHDAHYIEYCCNLPAPGVQLLRARRRRSPVRGRLGGRRRRLL